MATDEIENGFLMPRVSRRSCEAFGEGARFIAIGRTTQGRAAFVVFTMRGSLIRPFSARYMQAEEVARYGP